MIHIAFWAGSSLATPIRSPRLSSNELIKLFKKKHQLAPEGLLVTDDRVATHWFVDAPYGSVLKSKRLPVIVMQKAINGECKCAVEHIFTARRKLQITKQAERRGKKREEIDPPHATQRAQLSNMPISAYTVQMRFLSQPHEITQMRTAEKRQHALSAVIVRLDEALLVFLTCISYVSTWRNISIKFFYTSMVSPRLTN